MWQAVPVSGVKSPSACRGKRPDPGGHVLAMQDPGSTWRLAGTGAQASPLKNREGWDSHGPAATGSHGEGPEHA